MSNKTVHLRFIFANHDGVAVEAKMDLSSQVKDLKEALIRDWPQECHVPVFTTHPTPVNVSIRPGGVAPPTLVKAKTLDEPEVPIGGEARAQCCGCTIL